MSKNNRSEYTRETKDGFETTVTEYDDGPYSDARGVAPDVHQATGAGATKEESSRNANEALDKR